MNDWIKMSDELPKVGQELWVWDGNAVHQWNVTGQWGITDEEFRKHCAKHNLTHWMPFITPQPPS